MLVGEKKANELGIYDISGNVHEWTNIPDSYLEGSGRVRRGGGWSYGAGYCELGYSFSYTPLAVATSTVSAL